MLNMESTSNLYYQKGKNPAVAFIVKRPNDLLPSSRRDVVYVHHNVDDNELGKVISSFFEEDLQLVAFYSVEEGRINGYAAIVGKEVFLEDSPSALNLGLGGVEGEQIDRFYDKLYLNFSEVLDDLKVDSVRGKYNKQDGIFDFLSLKWQKETLTHSLRVIRRYLESKVFVKYPHIDKNYFYFSLDSINSCLEMYVDKNLEGSLVKIKKLSEAKSYLLKNQEAVEGAVEALKKKLYEIEEAYLSSFPRKFLIRQSIDEYEALALSHKFGLSKAEGREYWFGLRLSLDREALGKEALLLFVVIPIPILVKKNKKKGDLSGVAFFLQPVFLSTRLAPLIEGITIEYSMKRDILRDMILKRYPLEKAKTLTFVKAVNKYLFVKDLGVVFNVYPKKKVRRGGRGGLEIGAGDYVEEGSEAFSGKYLVAVKNLSDDSLSYRVYKSLSDEPEELGEGEFMKNVVRMMRTGKRAPLTGALLYKFCVRDKKEGPGITIGPRLEEALSLKFYELLRSGGEKDLSDLLNSFANRALPGIKKSRGVFDLPGIALVHLFEESGGISPDLVRSLGASIFLVNLSGKDWKGPSLLYEFRVASGSEYEAVCSNF